MSYLGDDTTTDSKEYKPVDEGKYQATLEDVRYDDTKEDPRISLMWRLGNNMVTWTNLMFKDTTRGVISSALEGLDVKDQFKAKTENCSSHKDASKIAFDLIAALKDNDFGITVKHTARNDGGVWVNTYVNEPMASNPEDFAPNATPKTEAAKFDASENVPF